MTSLVNSHYRSRSIFNPFLHYSPMETSDIDNYSTKTDFDKKQIIGHELKYKYDDYHYQGDY